MRSDFWNKGVFKLVIFGCGVFVLLTLIAMVFYPGGTFSDPGTEGYSFFGNFFSELGMVRTHAGGYKTISLILFAAALILVGIGLILFFFAFAQRWRRTRLERMLGAAGSLLGVFSGLCFIGVALFPLDTSPEMHYQVVIWAFRLFPAAILCFTIILFHEQGVSSAWAWAMVIFLLLLVAYIILLESGPAIGTDAGRTIQAVGQKIIVYASIFSVSLQSWGVLRPAA